MGNNVSKELLKVSGVSAGYGQKEIIKDVSFSATEGDFIAVIGPNGAGKTTLFRALTSVLPLSKGSVFYRGKDTCKINSREFAREITAMPQIVEAPFSFTVEEFVFLARFAHLGRFDRPTKIDLEALEQALFLTDIAGLRIRRISELSGGERQRVLLAQCLAQSPLLLFLDEPTVHLDIAHEIAIMNIIKKLNKENAVTVIMILHDLNLAAEYCREIMLLNDGRIFRKGVPDDVLTGQNIREVYGVNVLVQKNPISEKPFILIEK
jgi:iron complex transport system ATP-binding protein